eukprot:gene4935-5418_t
MIIFAIAATQALSILVLSAIILWAIIGIFKTPKVVSPVTTIYSEQLMVDTVFDRIDSLKGFICLDSDVIDYVQRQLWLKAHIDLYGHAILPMNDKDMGFYHEAFGALDVTLYNNTRNFSSLVYYRMYKGGNDNIRAMLFEYAFNVSNESERYGSSGCPADWCSHKAVMRRTAIDLRELSVPFPPDRFVFTFVRHPIIRFISAMNEVENRAQEDPAKAAILAKVLKQPLGSVERVKEFIHMILSSGGTGSLFRLYEDVELKHIAPMVGPLLLAHSVERSMIRLYKLEQFGLEWKRLSRNIELPVLYDLYQGRSKRRDWLVHASSMDSHNVTRAAAAFLFIAGADLLSMGSFKANKMKSISQFQRAFNLSDQFDSSGRHLRALCRLYFADFLCSGYSLPVVCQSIINEASDSVEELKHNIMCASMPSKCK